MMRMAIFGGVCLASFVCGCNSNASIASPEDAPLTQKVGANCIVQFRRDALGAAAILPVPPTTGEINGASVTIAGKLVQVSHRWIVIHDGRSGEYFVPRETVLMLEFGR